MTTILVGVDDSSRSLDAIAFAHRVASGSNASVLVANSFPYEDYRSGMTSLGDRKILQTEAEDLVSRLSAELDDLGEERVHTAVVARHSPAHGLHDLAPEVQADLVVVGSSHIGTVGRVLPGSTGERMLHGAACPVAIVPRDYRSHAHSFNVIGVAYDGSPESTVAVRAATEVARRTGSELRVIRVMDTTPYGTPARIGAPSYVFRDGIELPLGQDLDQAVAALPAEASATAVFLMGDPADELAAQTSTLDVLITGSRGYGPLRAVMTGSVTGRVLRHAACPVVVLPRGVESNLGELFGHSVTAPA